MTKLYCMKADGFDSQSGGFTDVIINDKYYSKDTIVKALQDYEQLKVKGGLHELELDLEAYKQHIKGDEFIFKKQEETIIDLQQQLDEMKAGKLLLAKALGITDEPRWKWIMLEVENMKEELDAIHRQQEPVVKVMWCNGIIASSISPSMNLYGYEPLYLHPSADALESQKSSDAIKQLETEVSEASRYVESVIVMRTGFTGNPPYVGWKGLGLALTEYLDELEEENDSLKAQLAQFSSEPVAWLSKNHLGEEISIPHSNLFSGKQTDWVRDKWKDATPLYSRKLP